MDKDDQFEKPTFRAVNSPYMVFGIIDWRYGFFALIPAVFIGAIYHSRMVFVFAALFWQVVAYFVYSKDATSPVIFITSLADKKVLSPFKDA